MKTVTLFYKYKEKEVPVNIRYSYQRNIYYRYREDGFYVSAPHFTSKKRIIAGLDKFAEKLVKQFQQAHSNFSFEEDYVYLLGEKVSLSSLNIKNLQELEGFLKEKALLKITELVRKNEEIMEISEPYKVVVRNTVRQFGSNSKRTHKLSFQINLVHFSSEIIESVVIHELAHEFERNHSENFYNIVYRYCPNYKAVQRKLKKGIHQ